MIIGPVFTRELTIVPRRDWTYIARGIYAGVMLLLISTAWLVISGTQLITDPGDFARFGTMLFQFLAPVQMVLAVFFAATIAASAVGQEKERKTLQLLLLTRMTNSELVLGKLFASLLNILMMLAISIPIFMIITLLGGISYYQIIRVLLVTLFAMTACGSLGSCVALWREKTFQAIATTIIILVLWISIWETIGMVFPAQGICQKLASSFSPWSAVLIASRPAIEISNSFNPLNIPGPIAGFLIACGTIAILINLYAIIMIRYWNPSREMRNNIIEEDTWHNENVQENAQEKIQENVQILTADKMVSSENIMSEKTVSEKTIDGSINVTINKTDDSSAVSNPKRSGGLIDILFRIVLMRFSNKARHVWDNPIVWREIMTRAYGRRIWVVQFGFFAFFVLCLQTLHTTLITNAAPSMAELSAAVVPLFLLSLVLVNTQAITSQTSEKDAGTFELLLVSDITSKEYVLGKLGGVFFNMKWIILLPVLICGYLYFHRAVDGQLLFFLIVGLITLYAFVAMVGIYIGMQYDNTKAAMATSLGIVFFLFVGVAACIWIMVAFSGSFETQLIPFSAFMIGGGIGLYTTLGARNPSTAIATAAFILPISVFYIITTMLLGAYHLVFVVLVSAFGFTTIAMLIPSIAEFDIATGRTTDS
ncbi:MAG: ABC transporter permease subunit [Planctomycetaceae bacterium]|jgi:ABC-type transport system involved in multi-copper enzyme maturation permease subunit|nr:ABC transporter permease subunit [Planctomycetaceae bacterium]